MTQVIQKIDLVDGQFTASEACDIVSALIDEKINFHKIQRLGQFINDNSFDPKDSEERIVELQKERKIARDFIAKARAEGGKIRINGTLEITYDQ